MDAIADDMRTVLDLYNRRMEAEDLVRRQRPAGLPSDEAWLNQFLLAVGPATGRLLNLLARSLTSPTILELGTSYGYSGLWLADAARATNGRVITMELHDYKSTYARQMAEKAGLAERTEYLVGDAVEMLATLEEGLDFVLVDLWKQLYEPCLELFYPKLKPGAIIVADNMIRPGGEPAERYRAAIRGKPGITSVLLPIGTGVELSRFDP